jgi:aflatoxin B1 aldehyde reductase
VCRLKIYLGTMTFGWSQSSVPVDAAVASEMVRLFVEAGGTAVDTARIYSGGVAEGIVGVACTPYTGTLRIGTKAHPSQPGGLGAAGLRAQFDASVSALGASFGGTGPAVEELYLHQPDTEHALQESLIAADALVREGRVRRIGLSSYHAHEVQRAMELCDRLGLAKQSVYQGLYIPPPQPHG